MKSRTVIVPLNLPRLSDPAAAQCVELLHQLVNAIEHHYAHQVHRHRKRARKIDPDRKASPPTPFDHPF
jgi:hypothetical protein